MTRYESPLALAIWASTIGPSCAVTRCPDEFARGDLVERRLRLVAFRFAGAGAAAAVT
jgi:hypothetical protein